jgi:acyl dehydratase
MSFYVTVGDVTRFSKTVGEADVYGFAGITGDFSPNHVNEHAMRDSPYGGRIAHGALMIGYMSTTSTMACEAASRRFPGGEMPVSLGYDRIRFLKGVRIGDTITVTYTIAEIDTGKRRSRADIEVKNQEGELVAAGQHILKWVTMPPAAA